MTTLLHIKRIALLVVLLSLTASGLYWWQLFSAENQLRSETIAQAELRARQLNGSVADQVDILIRYVDFAAQELAESYEPGKSRGFVNQANKIALRFPPHSLLQIAVIDDKGFLAVSSLGVKGKVFLGDRDHFRIHANSEKQRLFISAPVFGRVSKQWTIQFTRPIWRNGRFAGVVVFSLSPEYLHKTLAAVALASDDSISIIRESGEYLARNQGIEKALGQSVTSNRGFLGPDAAPRGSFRDASKFDKILRLYQWQRLSEAPVIVILGISEETLLKPVEEIIAQNRRQAGAAMTILWLFTFGAVALLLRLNAQQNVIVESARQVQHLAFYDSLTDLPNRRLLIDRLRQSLAVQKRNLWFGAVIFIDLDNFKQLNDRHGHAVGDLLLIQTADRLRGCVREMDTVARFGGDEFVMIINELEIDKAKSRLLAGSIAEKIRTALSKPFVLNAQGPGKDGKTVEHLCSASIGVAVFNSGDGNEDDILNWADHAMYRAKEAGKNTVCFYGETDI
jgi:diguanylate cyclase (GGDEF)-like protein